MTQPVPLLSGMKLTPARLNVPTWTSYSVQWTAATTNPTLGNGVLTGKYRYLDSDVVLVRIRLEVGSTTSLGSGQYSFSLPVPAVQGGPDPNLDAVALIGGNLYSLVGWKNVQAAPATSVAMYRINITTQEAVSSWTGTAPVTLASASTFSMYGMYFVA